MRYSFGGDTNLSPDQIKQRREFARLLMDKNLVQPQNVPEGMNAIARALVSRGTNRLADKADEANRSEFERKFGSLFGGRPGYAGGGGVSAPSKKPAASSGLSMGSTEEPAQRDGVTVPGKGTFVFGEDAGPPEKDAVASYIAQAAQKRGIDPDVALKVAASEGLNADPNEAWQSRVVQNGKRERSYGPFQLYIDGGLGNQFMEQTGLDPRDPSTWQAQVDFALDHAAQNGWGAWYGARNIGLDNMAGIGGGPSGGQGGVQVAQAGGGFDMGLLADLASSPYATEGQKLVLGALLEQQMQANDPMYRLNLENQQLQNERLRNPAPDLTSGQREYEMAKSQGYEGSFMDFKRDLAEAQRSQTNVNVNTGSGPELGKLSTDYGYVLDPETGKPRIDPETGLPQSAPVPGSPAAREIAEAEQKQETKKDQQKLKLGTSLTSINMNINEIEDGGLPVTGPMGDFRRTGVGRFLTGSDAVDFGNRTDQITDSAALAEVQNMRDNSPTGGAVGQLTDSERVAIGNSVTALNNSTSPEEYIRAAKAYRKLALDLAYGEGNWTLDEAGNAYPAEGAGDSKPTSTEPSMSFEQFSANPDVQAAAKKYGVSVEDMWEIEQGQK